MHLSKEKHVGVLLIFFFCFANCVHAQMASSKNLSQLFNNEIDAKIAQSNAGKSQQKQKKFVSEEKDIKAIVNSKIKGSSILQHTSIVTSEDEMKKKSPANAKDLSKQGQKYINATYLRQ